jgi:hypothetical protein
LKQKAKTVFEEVGDWLFKKIDEMKKTILKIVIAYFWPFLCLRLLMSLRRYSVRKEVYDRMNPPDVVISTVPSGAVVSMKTKAGELY